MNIFKSSPPHLQSLYEKIRAWEEEGPGVEKRAEWVRSCDRREKLKGDGAKPGSIYILIQWSEAEEEDHCRSRLPPSLNLSSAATCHRRRRGDPSWFSILQVRQPNFQRFFLATSDPAKTTNVKSTPSSLSPSLAPTPSQPAVAGKRPKNLTQSKEQKVASRPLEFVWPS